ncbi:MAG: thiamine pyrophosphate-dependent enzyme [Rectinemataceae bacterium]
MAEISSPALNALGLPLKEYQGSKSTLCEGCGHNMITTQIVQAVWESGIEPHGVAKISGIGCSSKATAYFLGKSWGFNTLHGRAAPVMTGALLANSGLLGILISGDGDSLSIGTNHFVHMVRRNVPAVYVIADNGVYGLTKGQFSATSDIGSALKRGAVNELPPIDPCALAIELGCGFVARSYAGNGKQLKALLRAAMAYGGLAIIDCLSPCVTFNNHETSTRSYRAVSERTLSVHDMDFVMASESPTVELAPGESQELSFPDGSTLRLKATETGFDPSSRARSLDAIHDSVEKGAILTGLLYHRPAAATAMDFIDLGADPLVGLGADRTRPSREALAAINKEFLAG